MTTTQKQDDQIADMSFAMIYLLYVAKVKKKGRAAEELAKGRKMEKNFEDRITKVAGVIERLLLAPKRTSNLACQFSHFRQMFVI